LELKHEKAFQIRTEAIKILIELCEMEIDSGVYAGKTFFCITTWTHSESMAP